MAEAIEEELDRDMAMLAVQPPEDAHGEREHRHQQHDHVLAALLQPKHPDTLILSPTPARDLPLALPRHLGALWAIATGSGRTAAKARPQT